MDPASVVIVVALQLIFSGLLLAFIARTLRDAGVGWWAGAALLFGASYMGRVFTGIATIGPWNLPLDVGMVTGTVLMAQGLRVYAGGTAVPRGGLVAVAIGFALVHVAAVRIAGDTGRYVALHAGLGVGYAVLAVMAWGRAWRHRGDRLAWPLLLLAVLMTGLAPMTLARGALVVAFGVETLHGGLFAQVFYAYAMVVGLLSSIDLLWLAFVRMNERLARLATHDPLTLALNRNGLAATLERHFAARVPRPLTVLQVDLDHFKRINDRHGHAAGDAVLRATADAVRSALRGDDFVARIGGEEFLVGCATGAPDVAAALAERLRGAIASVPVRDAGGRPIAVSASVGVSRTVTSRDAWDPAARDADAALYGAKRAGRNRVAHADDAIGDPGLAPTPSAFLATAP